MQRYIRKNTIEFRLERVEKRPTTYEMHKWLATKIGIKSDQVEGVQFDTLQNAVYVKFINETDIKNVIEKHGFEATLKTEEGVNVKVSIARCGENKKIVRILSFSLGIDNEKINEKLKEYGKIRLYQR